jgi:hypothetical protein
MSGAVEDHDPVNKQRRVSLPFKLSSKENGSKTEKAGLHLYTKYHDAVILQKKISTEH